MTPSRVPGRAPRRRPPPPLGGEGGVHIWWMAPDDADADARGLALLDPAEQARAARLRAERDRVRYVSHHAFARRVLARYLGVAPAEVRVRAGPHGKPEVEPACGIMYNMSRSGGLSVVAVTSARVGVDVERLRPIDDALGLADGLFAVRERLLLRTLPSASRGAAFLAMWTRKESVVKAFGMGLSLPLDSFDVSEASRSEAGRWHGRLGPEPFVVAGLDAPPGWVGAVAVAGRRLSVRYMDSAMVR